MTDDDQLVRELAYQLWHDAGCPSGRDAEFWLAAEQRIAAETVGGDPPEQPPLVSVLHGAPVGLPGERVSEQGVMTDGLDGLARPAGTGRPARPT